LSPTAVTSVEWGASDNNRRATFYKLTAAGRWQLTADTESWERLSRALSLIQENA
jgi:DNA-binding PadR family transcriptional regulator